MAYRGVWWVGLDGATFDVCRKWMDDGRLPNLKFLAERGQAGELQSTVPPWTAPAWTSFLTGGNPGEHGIFYFHKHTGNPNKLDFYIGADRKMPALWDVFAEHDIGSAFVSIPMTYPPPNINGLVAAGLDAPSAQGYVSPESAASEIRTLINTDLIEPPIRAESRQRNYRALLDKCTNFLEQQIAVFRWATEQPIHRFACVNLRATDMVQHQFWHFADPSSPRYEANAAAWQRDAIFSIYKRADEFLGELIAKLPKDFALVVMSDHGFGSESPHSIFLNNVLAAAGLLHYKTDQPAQGTRPIDRAIHWARLHTPQRLRYWAEANFREWVNRALPSDAGLIDFERTLAYADEYQETIWVNLVDREQHGCVPKENYEEVRAKIIKAFAALQHPATQQPAFAKVACREDVYTGQHVAGAGDVILIPNYKAFVQVRPSYLSTDREVAKTHSVEQLWQSLNPPGVHRPNGIMLSYGKLHESLGITIPSHIESTFNYALSLLGITSFNKSSEATATQHNLSPEDEKALLERLSGLGYVE